jgi:hypothetical protein
MTESIFALGAMPAVGLPVRGLRLSGEGSLDAGVWWVRSQAAGGHRDTERATVRGQTTERGGTEMQLSKRRAVAVLTAAALAGSATTAVSAAGHGGSDGGDGSGGHGGRALLDTSLAPSVPSDPVLNGASAGGAPWVLQRGDAVLKRDGRLVVRIRGLVIPTAPGNGTPGPVMTVSASLYCGGASTATGTTPSVPISSGGDASMEGPVSLPAKCLTPTVLIHPNGAAGVYIAATGFGA